MEESDDIKKLMVLNFSLVEKGNFYELPYVINHEKCFGQQICHLKHDMLRVEIVKSLVFPSFDVEKDNCPCFYVSNTCVDVKLKSFHNESLTRVCLHF